MALQDLGAYLEDDGLEYPVSSPSHPDGKVYRVPSPDAKTGLWLASMADSGLRVAGGGDLSGVDPASLKLDDDEEKTFYQRVLGPAYAELIGDGVSWVKLQRIALHAFAHFALGSNVAEALVAASEGKASAPNRAARRAITKKTAGGRSSRASGGSAKRTREPDSPASSTPPNDSAEPASAAAI